jgi:hypothetical protein
MKWELQIMLIQSLLRVQPLGGFFVIREASVLLEKNAVMKTKLRLAKSPGGT